ncbi:MAG: moaA 2 [Verrucomicrobiaceae bacterium]|nr:moaA 2 [Verrucomicrobiaceae bacterium]
MSAASVPTPRLIDRFGRQVTYVRLSVTDRCDFRCIYCMAEEMTFLPRNEILSLEELALIGRAFVELGVSKIRLTGGEPLVRSNVAQLARELRALPGLRELTLTTNGSRLVQFAPQLREAGLDRINISLDSLRPDRFREITRFGKLAEVLAGIEAARTAGFKRIKLNAVILRGRNDDEILDLVRFARDRELDLSFIEEMPLGNISEHDRAQSFCSSDSIRRIISSLFPLTPSMENSGGPARYYRMSGSDSRIGFISPHSHNFCHLCNRVRVTVDGRLLLCLGNEHSADLRAVLRDSNGDIDALKAAIVAAMGLKPESHHFELGGDTQIVRFMNMTGG